MNRTAVVTVLVLVASCVAAAGSGCSGESKPKTDTRRSERPLQPLVYTEDSEHGPEASAVRDRRLMRRLLEGSDDKGSWGDLDADPQQGLPVLDSPEALGASIYQALIEQNDRQWDHLFVEPRAYASLVRIELDKARRYVDDKQAEARDARDSFRIEKPSEAPRDGLDSVFAFKQLELGESRTLQGDLAGEDDVVAQYWDNKLHVGLRDGDVEFTLRIPKIIRIQTAGNTDTEGYRLGVASDIHLGPRLRVFLNAGLHLKPELLRSFDYPIPLEVGNYWRYARRLADSESLSEPDSPPAPDELPAELEASSVTVRVESVDRYDTRRLVHLRFRYNDADLTNRDEYWLITPRRIFQCPRPCRRHIDDLDWLLSYLGRQTPLFRFPISRGDNWGQAGADSADPTFRVGGDWHNVEVPGGTFVGTLAIEGLGPLDRRLPFHRVRNMTRLFAPGKGIVQRRYQINVRDPQTVVESLVDYRIMPH